MLFLPSMLWKNFPDLALKRCCVILFKFFLWLRKIGWYRAIRLALNSNCGLEGTGVAEIKTLYVRPRHHHRGIGKALLRAGLSALEAAGHTSPWLMVNAQNQEAMEFTLPKVLNGLANVTFASAMRNF